MEHFFWSDSGEDQKEKGLHQKGNTFFAQIQVKTNKISPNSRGHLRL